MVGPAYHGRACRRCGATRVYYFTAGCIACARAMCGFVERLVGSKR